MERNPNVSTSQIPIILQLELQPVTPTPIPQKDSLAEGLKAIAFMKRLAGDLQYTGLSTDVDTLDHFIYGDLEKRVGRKTSHVRRNPFTELQVRNTNATKKIVRKVAQKTPVKRIITQKVVRHCSACGKAGHTKVNCPGVKRTKKVNYVYQDEVEDPENSEEEYLVEEEDSSQEEEIEDDDVEYVEEDDSESRNCYAVKKKWCEVEYL